MSMKIIVSAGGTGGHIYPALGIIDILKKYDKNLEVLYIGTHNRMEKDIIPERKIKYIPIEIYGFNKKRIGTNIKNVFLIQKAYKKCIKLMKEFKPDLVIGCGGYVTFPVIKAAQKCKIKTLLHEQNSFPGKSNIALAKNATLVGASIEKSMDRFKNCKGKVFLMGNPCGQRALDIKEIKKSDLGFDDKKPLVCAVAGSSGSVTVNKAFKDVIKKMGDKDYQFLYITGKKYYEEFIKGEKFPKNVKVMPYVDNFSGLLKNIDILVSRAGASTISEVIALKVPTIFIPSPYVANNHQYYNALDIVNVNAGRMIEEKDFNSQKLFDEIDYVIKNNDAIKSNLSKIKTVDTEKVLIKEIKEII